MTRLEKCIVAKSLGYKYNPDTGLINKIRGFGVINSKTVNGYIVISFNHNDIKIRILAHQYAYYFHYGVVADLIDHINRNKTDNRISNLRSSNKSENAFNSNQKGFSLNKRKKLFEAYIKRENKKKHLGYFKTESSAREAYEKERNIILENKRNNKNN